jgi:hypothetical protein
MGRSSGQLFRALAGATHPDANVGSVWPMDLQMRDSVIGAGMPGQKLAGQYPIGLKIC